MRENGRPPSQQLTHYVDQQDRFWRDVQRIQPETFVHLFGVMNTSSHFSILPKGQHSKEQRAEGATLGRRRTEKERVRRRLGRRLLDCYENIIGKKNCRETHSHNSENHSYKQGNTHTHPHPSTQPHGHTATESRKNSKGRTKCNHHSKQGSWGRLPSR